MGKIRITILSKKGNLYNRYAHIKEWMTNDGARYQTAHDGRYRYVTSLENERVIYGQPETTWIKENRK